MTEGFQVQSQASAGIFPWARRGPTNASHPSGVGRIGRGGWGALADLNASSISRFSFLRIAIFFATHNSPATIYNPVKKIRKKNVYFKRYSSSKSRRNTWPTLPLVGRVGQILLDILRLLPFSSFSNLFYVYDIFNQIYR